MSAQHRVTKTNVQRKRELLSGLRALLQTHHQVQTAEPEYVRGLEERIKGAEVRMRDGR